MYVHGRIDLCPTNTIKLVIRNVVKVKIIVALNDALWSQQSIGLYCAEILFISGPLLLWTIFIGSTRPFVGINLENLSTSGNLMIEYNINRNMGLNSFFSTCLMFQKTDNF